MPSLERFIFRADHYCCRFDRPALTFNEFVRPTERNARLYASKFRINKASQLERNERQVEISRLERQGTAACRAFAIRRGKIFLLIFVDNQNVLSDSISKRSRLGPSSEPTAETRAQRYVSHPETPAELYEQVIRTHVGASPAADLELREICYCREIVESDRASRYFSC
jgi:hypothetical protein